MIPRRSSLLFAVVILLFSLCFALADLDSHKYQEGEELVLWANKVGPFRNPQETYPFYSLPFCSPQKLVEKSVSLGEALQGYELIKSPIKITFKHNALPSSICTKELSPTDVEQFIHAIKNQYWYQLFLDDLPMWGMVGEYVESSDRVFIYTHLKFSIAHNNDRIIEVNMTAENPAPLQTTSTKTSIPFTYSVTWTTSTVSFEDRFDKYLDDSFFEHQIHWFSIFNSLMMVVFLVGLVSIILMRILRKDYARFTRDLAEEVEEDADEHGWKQIHGDVFRPPNQLILLSTVVGTGHQLALMVFCVLFCAILGTYYRNRGATVTAFIVCYSFTSFVAGFSGGGFYSRNNGKNWIKNMLLTATLFPGVCFLIALSLNMIASQYNSLSYIPFSTLLALVLIWTFVSFPLTFFGTIIGKNCNGTPSFPCRVHQIPRPIPDRKWFLKPWVNVLLGGILPFGSIFIEMYFILTSIWHYKFYYVYGFMLLVYIILIIVTVCVTIVSTYILLNAEDYRWHWTSFLSSGSTAFYVFGYSVYYFVSKTKMSGFFQTSFYLGYMLMFCFGLFILCGSVGFVGTSVFVRRIYRNIKIE